MPTNMSEPVSKGLDTEKSNEPGTTKDTPSAAELNKLSNQYSKDEQDEDEDWTSEFSTDTDADDEVQALKQTKTGLSKKVREAAEQRGRLTPPPKSPSKSYRHKHPNFQMQKVEEKGGEGGHGTTKEPEK